MTVTTDDITDNSTYVLGTDYTVDQFNSFHSKALVQFGQEDPGLPAELADEAVMLLILHRISRITRGQSDKESEKMGDYSYSRDGTLGKSSYWMYQYKELLKVKSSDVLPSRGVQRSDIKGSKAFRFTESDLPKIDYVDGTIREQPF
jgi:hypothetical protein